MDIPGNQNSNPSANSVDFPHPRNGILDTRFQFHLGITIKHASYLRVFSLPSSHLSDGFIYISVHEVYQSC